MARVPVIRTVKNLRVWRQSFLLEQKTLGMVPTMGALHNGHLELLKQSLQADDATVVSVFVNPSQFAPHEDLDAYPRTIDSDIESIENCAATLGKTQAEHPIAIFAPTVSEMYPNGISLEISKQKGAFVEVLGYGSQLEGTIRPHFFRGVATVVTKLLCAVLPEKAYFGQKDMQQCAVVRRLTQDLLLPTEIVVGPTVREANGLAMSSRNVYLSEAAREDASIIYHALTLAKQSFQKGETDAAKLLTIVRHCLDTSDLITEIEYISLNDAFDLSPLETAREGAGLSLAVKVNSDGKTIRLIDNIIL